MYCSSGKRDLQYVTRRNQPKNAQHFSFLFLFFSFSCGYYFLIEIYCDNFSLEQVKRKIIIVSFDKEISYFSE